jgi:signal transduction histidine kinase
MRTKTRPNPPSTASRKSAPAADNLGAIVSKLASTQQELDALYSQLERLNRLASIGTIAGMIAHEFNNILTPMLSYSQMALAAPEDRELTRKALSRTLAGSERAAKVADAILSFVRDEEGHKSGDMFHVEQAAGSPAHIASVVRDSLICLARDSAHETVDGAIQVPDSLFASIQPIALQQVLVNLILNARNAMEPKGGLLEISAFEWLEAPPTPRGGVDSRNSDSGVRSTWNAERASSHHTGPWICVVIRDSGRGMTSERLAHMFRPFDTAPLGEHRGTGLGMVIAKRLVERAGGWLIVESRQGQGTTIQIVLPSTT